MPVLNSLRANHSRDELSTVTDQKRDGTCEKDVKNVILHSKSIIESNMLLMGILSYGKSHPGPSVISPIINHKSYATRWGYPHITCHNHQVMALELRTELSILEWRDNPTETRINSIIPREIKSSLDKPDNHGRNPLSWYQQDCIVIKGLSRRNPQADEKKNAT
jgi:hypothetical protein